MRNSTQYVARQSRKAMLIEEGAAYRLAIVRAKVSVADSARIQSLMQRGISIFAHLLLNRHQSAPRQSITAYQILVPLALQGGRLLWRRGLVKPAVYALSISLLALGIVRQLRRA